MCYAYLNNGFSSRKLNDYCTPDPSEVTFKNEATEQELLAAFPGRAEAIIMLGRIDAASSILEAIGDACRFHGYDNSNQTSTLSMTAGYEHQAEAAAIWAWTVSCFTISDGIMAGTLPIDTPLPPLVLP